MAHIPVLLNEVLKFLKPQNGDTFLDATINGGGHSMAIFEHIVPEKGETVVEFRAEELLSTIKMAAIFARESAHIIKWDIEKKRVVIEANSPEVGENKSVVEAEVKGPGGRVAFNSRYLLDYLNTVEAKSVVVFEMGGTLAPGLFKTKGDKSFSHVIMPVRVQDKEREEGLGA